jgi:anti-sigma B factor antagonist
MRAIRSADEVSTAKADHTKPRKDPPMPDPEFQYIRVTMVKEVAVVEVLVKDIQGPKAAQDLGAELGLVAAQQWAQRLLVNFSRVGFMSSTGFAILFRLVSQAKAEGRQVKLCRMEPGMRLGAEIVGLDKVTEIHPTEESALRAFEQG